MADTVRSHDVYVDGVCSPVWEAGRSDSSETVVFVHGHPGPASDFAPILEQVATFARAVAPDLPGFGRADKPDDFDHTIEGHARHLGGVLDALGVRRAHFVTHDWGGPFALQWAAAHPDRFASVVLINTGLLLGYRWHLLARLWQRRWVGEASMAMLGYPTLKAILRLGAKRRVPDDAVRAMCDNLSAPTRRAALRLYRATDMAEYAARLYPQIQPLRRPALVVWGQTDVFISSTYARRQAEVFGDTEVVMLESSGHFPLADDPEAVAAAVVPFLRSQCAPRTDPDDSAGA